MINIQAIPVDKILIALLAAAFAFCVVGGVAADQPEWIQSIRKLPSIRARSGKSDKTGENGIQSVRRKAEEGDADEQFHLGLIFYKAKGVPQDYTEAAKWFHRAAEQGHIWAHGLLGGMYYMGRGVPQNYAKAVHHARLAVEWGDPTAQATLGAAYYFGHGVTRDRKEAYVLCSMAATYGTKEAADIRDKIARELSPEELSAAQEEAVKRHEEIQQKLEETSGE